MSSGPPEQTSTEVAVPRRAAAPPLIAVLCAVGSGGAAPEERRIVRLADRCTIGRGAPQLTDDLWQLPDETVSRRHAVIAGGPAGWTVSDLDSRNGTAVGRVVLKGTTVGLDDGALIGVGAHLAVFRLITEDRLLAVQAEQERPLGPVATASPALAEVARKLRILGASDRPILLAGETGTGKEVYARAVHEVSCRAGPFVAVNCASLQRDLLESELFGFKRGSHSQATDDHPGLVSSAEGGTLFLDEIGEMPHPVQAQLLRFLQDRTFYGLGWLRARRADVRVMAATNGPQESLRPDIRARFGPEPFVLPPLRKRREDLGVLSWHFLAATAQGSSSRVRGFDKQAFLALCHHQWPGNVRELAAAIADAVLLATDRGSDEVTLQDLPAQIRDGLLAEVADLEAFSGSPTPPGIEPAESLRARGAPPPRARRRKPCSPPARDELLRLLGDSAGDVPALARRLDRRREQVWRWCKSLGVDPREFRKHPK